VLCLYVLSYLCIAVFEFDLLLLFIVYAVVCYLCISVCSALH